jgi:hypothetical protein
MCPFCIAAGAQITLGAVSIGGLTALVASRHAPMPEPPRRRLVAATHDSPLINSMEEENDDVQY